MTFFGVIYSGSAVGVQSIETDVILCPRAFYGVSPVTVKF
jgi:hypothetical protein